MAPMENSPPGTQAIPFGALLRGGFLFATVAAKSAVPQNADLHTKSAVTSRIARSCIFRPYQKEFTAESRKAARPLRSAWSASADLSAGKSGRQQWPQRSRPPDKSRYFPSSKCRVGKCRERPRD